jgi:predicted RND superfamily exporter protein
MLQSLFQSQVLTIGIVFLAIMLMFMILFRSVRLAFIAIIPNLLPAVMVLGTMGWLSIPLNMMTITIASITIGIAVDDTIHYIHRFQREFPKDRNYMATLYRCHCSIGRAMYYTSITIIIGFSILIISNFVPTIYFGFSTGFAMLVALLAALTLLPQLLILLKPLGPEDKFSEKEIQ